MTMPLDVEEKLRETAQLWRLGQQLPHVSTPAEERLLEEFARFASGERPDCERLAALAGMRSFWASRRWREIVDAFARMTEAQRRDRDLRAYGVNAGKLLQTGG